MISSPFRSLLARVFSIALFVGGSLLFGWTAQNSPTEFEVKAAYLYQFGKFIEWPEGTFPPNGGTFTICTLGMDPFGSALDETVSGRTVQGKQIQLRRLDTVADAEDCNILFVGASEQKHFADIANSLVGKGVLTVSDSGDFLTQGGMISFRIEENKVRFEVSLAAVERAKLKLSSQLLKVAKLRRE